jgi:glutamate-1-semialdehyde 2,1-aminomutase
MNHTQSHKLFEKACRLIPGGVNSPVRAFKSVKNKPVYIVEGSGSVITDVDSNQYIDFCSSWGPLILGHNDPDVRKALNNAAEKGLSFGTCSPYEVEMAELLKKLVPNAEMFRMVNSGTEAVMTALRMARGFTGKKYIIKFDGCYHGHSDSLLVNAGSGLLTNSVSSSAGVTEKQTAEVMSLQYGNAESIQKAFEKYPDDIAAVIIEPVAGNMGLVKPEKTFLELLRKLCTEHSSCLIFDEVITGFRFHAGAYADIAGITPDIFTFGKIIGAGMPIGAVAASEKIASCLAPLGNVYQAGTLSGNPAALAAGIAGLKKLEQLNPYPEMTRLAGIFADEVNKFAAENNIPAICVQERGVFTLFFKEGGKPENLNDVQKCSTETFADYHNYMLEHGFYIPPSQFELNFVSAAHTEKDIRSAAECAVNFLKTLK